MLREMLLAVTILLISTMTNFYTQAVSDQPYEGTDVALVAGWTYNGKEAALEPSRWAEKYPECNGMRNSPIDIETENVATSPLANTWLISGWDTNSIWNITYEKYSVSLNLTTGSPRIGLSGGHLPGNYSMVEMHFHWGMNDSRGSEHTINGNSFPMELHCLHLNAKYRTVKEALSSNDSDAIAVLAFMFKIHKDENPALNRLINGLNETLHINKTNKLYNLGKLTDFLSESARGEFWRYEGSLTTPSCKQRVVWTIFRREINISASQIQVLRSFQSNHFGTELYRPSQPLNNRTVEYFEPTSLNTEADNVTKELVGSKKQQVTEPSTKAEISTKLHGMGTKLSTMMSNTTDKQPTRRHRTDLETLRNSNQNLKISLKLQVLFSWYWLLF